MTELNKARRSRSGVSLLEVAVATAANMAVLAAATSLLLSMRSADRRLGAGWHERMELARLTDRLRHDVRRAESYQWDAERQTLSLTLPQGQRADYRMLDREIVREWRTPDVPAPSSMLYRIPRWRLTTVEPPTGRSPQRLQARFRLAAGIEATDRPAAQAGRALDVVVYLGAAPVTVDLADAEPGVREDFDESKEKP